MVAAAVWLEESSCATVTKAFVAAIADPTWVMSTIATYYGIWLFLIPYLRRYNGGYGYSQQ